MIRPLIDVNFREALGVPQLGIIGAEAIREAFEGDLTQLRDLLQGEIKRTLELAGEEDWWPYIHGLFDSFIVVEAKDGKLLKYTYTIDGTEVTLGTPVEVRKDFVPVEADDMREAQAGAFIEAGDQAGGAWRIRVIRAGLSGNGNFYPDSVLREAVELFEGVRVFVKSDAEHLAGRGKDVRNLIGQIVEPSFVEGKGADSGEIHAAFHLIEPDGAVGVKLREAWERGMTGLFGFSIDVAGRAAVVRRNGASMREAQQFIRVNSVDLIVEAGAGGAVIDLIEAKGTQIMNREEIIALLEAKGLLKNKDVDSLTDGQLQVILREALDQTTDPGGEEAASDNGEGNGEGDLREAVRMVEARAEMRRRIDDSTLPASAKNKLIKQFSAQDAFVEADVDAAIRDEADYLASFTESGAVQGLGDGMRIETGETRAEKTSNMLEAFFDPEHRDHRHARSFRECYIQITGDTRVTGLTRNCDESLMREALSSTSFDDVLGDSITRRMVKDYNTPTRYDIWKQLVTVVPVMDFRTQERTRFGGYGDIPAVAENGTYDPLTSPGDEKATYAVGKKGGTESVTLEMIKNDDVGAIRVIPTKLSRAAKRTLGKFVLDFLRTNPAIYDGVTLFHASHGNLGAAALTASSLAAGRLAMLKQAELGSADPLGIGPEYLWVSPDNEETAVDLFRRNTENDKNFVQSLALQVMPVWYWTDVNDWCLSANTADIPTIEIGFLDGNEEPELFVQDSPTGGSMFTNDRLTWKLRHIYGGAATEFRGLYKAVVV